MWKIHEIRKRVCIIVVAAAVLAVPGCGRNRESEDKDKIEKEQIQEAVNQPDKKNGQKAGNGSDGKQAATAREISGDIKQTSGEGTDGRNIEKELEEGEDGFLGEETKTGGEEMAGKEKDFILSPGVTLREEEADRQGLEGLFQQSPISDEVFQRIYGKSYKPDCTIPREELRYLLAAHYDFDGNIRIGELICSKEISDDLLNIFKELYQAEYPIESMVLVDEYDADDEASSGDNNTSCFNFRRVPGKTSMSKHAYGRAIDVNPLYNPYITRGKDGKVNCSPANGTEYMDRNREFPYKIEEEDLCCQVFKKYGFTWGGNWVNEPDYMHFSK
ncbi:M15 family metallopeptidase [Lachnospiraceae bacterium 62-35]